MGFRTVYLYLIGNRQAILSLASTPWTLVVGAIFVLSAALARDYDGEDLLHEPWHLLVPFGASLLASLVLFLLAWRGCRWPQGTGPGFARTYAAFLGCFWMTAPLAWLYAIPYERFLSQVEALRANLLTLGIVALWRVALMVRVLVVVLNYRVLDAIFVVMAFADALVLVAVSFLPVNLMDFMGGVRGSGSDVELKGVGCCVLQLGILSGLFWLPKLLTTIAATDRTSSPPSWPLAASRPDWVLWGMAMGSLAIWVPLLPAPQAEQQLRVKVEQDFRDGHISSALTEMSAHSQNDFPPHWEPPPRYTTYFEPHKDAQLVAIWEALLLRSPAPWVRDVYLTKLRDLLRHPKSLSKEDRERLHQVLSKLPETPGLLSELDKDSGETTPNEFWYALPRHLRPKDKNPTKDADE